MNVEEIAAAPEGHDELSLDQLDAIAAGTDWTNLGGAIDGAWKGFNYGVARTHGAEVIGAVVHGIRGAILGWNHKPLPFPTTPSGKWRFQIVCR